MYEGFKKDADRARQNWKVVSESEYPLLRGAMLEGGRGHWVRHVEAEVGNGTRFVVFATPLLEVAREVAGGATLITVLWPWQDAWTISGLDVDASYVLEHWGRGRDTIHGGDLMGLVLTIRRALDPDYEPVREVNVGG